MGYTASKTNMIIGLGVSSIGDSWYGFSQNVKGIEEYQHLIKEGIIRFTNKNFASNDILFLLYFLHKMKQ